MLRVPNALLEAPGTGRTHGPDQRAISEDEAHARFSRSVSALMRATSAGGGLTNAASTVSFRVVNVRGSTVSSWVTRPASERPATIDTSYRPGLVSRSIPTRTFHSFAFTRTGFRSR